MNKLHLEKVTNNQKKTQWIEKVDEFIWENISNPKLTVTDIANAVYTSERQFYRTVKKVTGKTPNKYLQQLRMKKAKELLETHQFLTVKEVANHVGYTRSDYFSRLYKAKFGIRPIQYFQF